MPKICYVSKRFSQSSLEIIEMANRIIESYAAQGLSLTLRQLYYQFVARDLIPNKQSEYKRLGSVINDARLAGMIDWEAIVDRTRNLQANSHWRSPRGILQSAASSFYMDHWVDQEYRPEVWIEKDALVGVIEGICRELDVPYFSCRGYTSQSEMWSAAQRLLSYEQTPVVIHLGDHDPSGIDMSRDIEDRLNLFMNGRGLIFRRIALNSDQIDEYNPPPNPTKLTDSRASGYIEIHGYESWELDALEPSVMRYLIDSEVGNFMDRGLFDEVEGRIEEHKQRLYTIAEEYGG